MRARVGKLRKRQRSSATTYPLYNIKRGVGGWMWSWGMWAGLPQNFYLRCLEFYPAGAYGSVLDFYPHLSPRSARPHGRFLAPLPPSSPTAARPGALFYRPSWRLHAAGGAHLVLPGSPRVARVSESWLPSHPRGAHGVPPGKRKQNPVQSESDRTGFLLSFARGGRVGT